MTQQRLQRYFCLYAEEEIHTTFFLNCHMAVTGNRFGCFDTSKTQATLTSTYIWEVCLCGTLCSTSRNHLTHRRAVWMVVKLVNMLMVMTIMTCSVFIIFPLVHSMHMWSNQVCSCMFAQRPYCSWFDVCCTTDCMNYLDLSMTYFT
jgi:hypothetical protein